MILAVSLLRDACMYDLARIMPGLRRRGEWIMHGRVERPSAAGRPLS